MDVPVRDLRTITEENRCLREENEILKKTVEQMNQTMNRLLNRFVTGHPEDDSAPRVYK